MLDQRVKVLISAALDGELSDEERAELDARLQDSEEARRYQAGLSRLDKLLAKAPTVPLPDQLHEQILARIELDRPRRRRVGGRQLPALLRYGAAAAAGLIIAAGIYEMNAAGDRSPDLERMVGTMAPSRGGPSEVIDADAFALEGLSGSASLERRDGALVLAVEFDSAEPVELRVTTAGNELSFDALAGSRGNYDAFEFADRSIRASGLGRQQFTVLLSRVEGSDAVREAAIRLAYRSREGLIREAILVPEPGSDRVQ